MSNPVQQASQVPLHELLLSVPADARLTINEGEFSTRCIPVGRLCHEAADALKAHQQAAQDVELPPLPGDISNVFTGPIWPHICAWAELAARGIAAAQLALKVDAEIVALMRAYARAAIAAHQARQAVPQGYAKTVIEALYENGDPVSVDAAELLQSLAAAPTPEASQPTQAERFTVGVDATADGVHVTVAKLDAGGTAHVLHSEHHPISLIQPTQAEAPSEFERGLLQSVADMKKGRAARITAFATQPTQAEAPSEREAFERHVTEGGKFPGCAHRDADGNYTNPLTHPARRSWLAALRYAALATQPTQAEAPTPAATWDECVASGQTCSYGAHGPNGEQQCAYCGSEPPTIQPAQAEASEHCEACNNTGLWHCSDPVNCGGPWDTQAEAPSGVAEWQARVGDRGLWTRIDPPKGETLEQRIQYLLGIRRTGGTPVYQVRALYTHPAPEQVEEFNGWYCAHCQRGVDGSEVTFREQHSVCGRVITNDRPPAPEQVERDLLDWMIFHSAKITHSNDAEYCWIKWFDDREEKELGPFNSARDAIRAAREAEKGGEV